MSDGAVLPALIFGILVAGALAVWGAALLIRRRPRDEPERLDAGLSVLQREIESVRTENRRTQEATLGAVHDEVARFGGQVGDRVAQLQGAVVLQLQQVTAEVNRQLQDGMALMQTAQSTMGQRLDQASRAVSAVHGQLGALGEATRRMEQVGRDIAGLEQILRAPKMRGGFGEVLLERLLAEILPSDAYRLQHTFRSGDKVDAAVVLGGKLVPVDSKFPLENFRRMVEESDEDRRRQARRGFLRDVRNRVDEIAKKYILPDEETFDFALMYIPAENVYYEVIIREETGDDSLLGYALGRRVVPVSPNSFYAYLQAIVLGLKGLRIESRAQEVIGQLARLTGDLGRMREDFRLLGKHLTNAAQTYPAADRRLERVEGKLAAIGGETDDEVPQLELRTQ